MSAFKPKYQFKKEAHIDRSIDAQIVGELCDTLSNTVGLTPKTLLDASREETAVLHGYFEWRDDIAAEKYREEQAKYIIRSIIVVPEQEEIPTVRAFTSILVDSGKPEYKTVNTVVSRPDWREQMLANAKRDLFAFQAKYNALRDYAELAEVFVSIENLKTEGE